MIDNERETNSSRDEDIGFPTFSDPVIQAYFDKYSGGLQNLVNEIKSAHPLHPETSHPGEFVRFAYKYPVYRTESGDEFFLQRGEPKTFKKLDE